MTKEEKFIGWLTPSRVNPRRVTLMDTEAKEIREYIAGLIAAGAETPLEENNVEEA